MSRAMQSNQLIFMISLPRSGSTMLQRILGSHDEIYTRSEPWLMLHPLYALKCEGIQTRYNAKLAQGGVRNFLSDLPENGEDLYYSKVRDCYLSLYEQYLDSSGKSRFLDKTPRYYEIYDELQRTFPEAKFIILYRNPIAVLSSILTTWVKEEHDKLKDYKGDLIEGVKFLQRDFSLQPNTYLIRYEELLQNPHSQIERLLDFLDLKNQPDCVDYGSKNLDRWFYGDPKVVYTKSRPDPSHAQEWQKSLTIPTNRKLLLDYLEMLGKPCIERLGYCFQDIESACLDSSHSSTNHNAPEELSLRQLLLDDSERISSLQTLNKELQDLNKELHDLNKELQENTIKKDHHITNIEANLNTCQSRATELRNTLTTLMDAAKGLTTQRALLHPIKKFTAYRELLDRFIAARRDIQE